MTKVDKLIREARQLPEPDRIRLLDEVARSLEADPSATQSDSRSYASLISIAGSVPSDLSDVSSEKYRHLAEANGDTQPFETTPAEERELLEAIAEAERGNTVSAAELLERLRR